MKWKRFVIVVIWIAFALIIILSIVFPAVTGSTAHPPEARDTNSAYNLKNAISAYFTEYREYPLRSPDIDITVDTRDRLMDILFGSESEQGTNGRNQRGICFYFGKAAKTKPDGSPYRGVTLENKGGGEFWDSWGNPYRVRLDTTFDNQVENPGKPGTFLPESILIWSAGPDGDFETWEDNVKTW